MPVFNNILAGAAGQTGGAAAAGPIKSVRFNDGDSAYLNRTPSSAGNTKTWTFSCWVKRSSKTVANNPALLSAGANSQVNGFLQITFESDEFSTYMRHSGGTNYAYTNAKLRDNSAWYHLVVAIDTTAATEADRLKMYINGVEQTFRISSIPSLNQTFLVNDTALHQIAATKNSGGTTNNFLPGYLADLYLIDGQALDPTSFGAFDDNGVWQAAAYTGTYGNNGFHLFDFANESGIGDDSSGNDNDFTVNNLTAAVDVDATPLPTAAGDAFNADTADYAYSGSTTKFTFATAESVSNGRVDLIGRTGANYTYKAITNAGTFTLTEVGTWPGLTAGTYTAHYSVTDSSITSLTAIQCESASGSWTLSGVQVAGDPSSVGNQLLVKSVGQFQDLDVLRDVPTNGSTDDDTGAGGEVSGNYCTWNPLDKATVTLANGNLDITAASTDHCVRGTIAVPEGVKIYYEFTVTQRGGGGAQSPIVGVANTSLDLDTNPGSQTSTVWAYTGSGAKLGGGSTYTSYGSSLSAGDVLGVAIDRSAGRIWFSLNGTWQNSGDPTDSTDTNAAFTNVPTTGTLFIFFANINGTPGLGILNAGQRAFAYSAPTDYKTLCTTNLTPSDVPDGSDYFDVVTYSGDTSSSAIDVDGFDFQPDLVWVKKRDGTTDTTDRSHVWTDSVRGAGVHLRSDGPEGEAGLASNLVTAFNSDGFTAAYHVATNYVNSTYVAWAWDAGTSTVNNTDGSITSSVRANASAGFSIVTWTGNGTIGATVGHGLNAAPELLLQKRRDASENWLVYHSATGNAAYLKLNSTDDAATGSGVWNTTDPTSSVFTLSDSTWHNANNGTFISYCFAPVEGYSAFGSYEGNGSNDGTFVHTGFSVRWLLTKASSHGSDWQLWDSARQSYNVNANTLTPNGSNVETGSAGYAVDFLSNGFKFRNYGSSSNQSGYTYIWAAFASNPFQANGGLAR